MKNGKKAPLINLLKVTLTYMGLNFIATKNELIWNHICWKFEVQ